MSDLREIHYQGQRVELSKGLSATSLQWNETRQRINDKIPGAKVNNEHLDRIGTEIQDIFNLNKTTSEEFDVHSIKNKLLNIRESKGILVVFDFYLESILAKLNKRVLWKLLSIINLPEKARLILLKQNLKELIFLCNGI